MKQFQVFCKARHANRRLKWHYAFYESIISFKTLFPADLLVPDETFLILPTAAEYIIFSTALGIKSE